VNILRNNMAFCLRKELVDAFKKALKGREIDVFKLMQMTTEERTAFLKKFVGDQAKEVNKLFESKLILKNRLQGIKNWASKVGEIGRYDPAKKAELETLMGEFKDKQQERMFSPAENEAFLADLVEQKFGTRITRTEAKTIFDLQTKADTLKEKFYDESKPAGQKWTSTKDRIQYGASRVVLDRYTNLLKTGDVTIVDMLKRVAMETKESWKINKSKAVGDLIGKMLKTITDNSISMVASFDNSFLGRQGLHTLMTEPGRFVQAKFAHVKYKNTWWNMAKRSFVDIWDTMKGKNAKEAFEADYLSRENNLNGEYKTAGIIPKTEEQFPTELPSRVPVLGRVYTAAQDAFTNSALRSRVDLYDFYKRLGEKNVVKWDTAQVKDVGTFINALTSRGTLPKIADSPIVKLVLWAPRMLKANWDVLTVHTATGGLETSFARKQAAINLVQVIATSAAIIKIANSIKPGSAETDPRSTNFGKIKIGNTTFDYTGGAGSLIVFVVRWISGESKSSTTGVVTKFSSEYGATSRFDVLINFLEGKTTPVAGAVIDWMKGRNFQGQKPDLANTAFNTFTPIMVQNALQLKDEHSTEAVLGVLLDGLGINANTYVPTTDWSQSTGVELQAFKNQVGDKLFKVANDKYNKRVNDWLIGIKLNPQFSTLSDTDKQKVITKKKSEIKDAIFKEYDFRYIAPKKTSLPKL
jgi:hypothetical protein